MNGKVEFTIRKTLGLSNEQSSKRKREPYSERKRERWLYAFREADVARRILHIHSGHRGPTMDASHVSVLRARFPHLSSSFDKLHRAEHSIPGFQACESTSNYLIQHYCFLLPVKDILSTMLGGTPLECPNSIRLLNPHLYNFIQCHSRSNLNQ